MRVVVGCPVKSRAWVLPRWFDAIEAQNVDVEVVCLVGKSEDDTLQIVKDRGALIIHDQHPGRPVHEIDGHVWGDVKTYYHMAEIRNALLTVATDIMMADYFFSLDSDIILPPGALKSLMRISPTLPGILAPAVNMARGQVAWNTMSWNGFPGQAHRPVKHPLGGKADVVMAALLFDKSAMGCRWKQHHQGEDVGLCYNAESQGVPRWWVPEIKCDHLMVRS